ncbi:hypothetical protein COT51_01435, partial [candidate division WWE3 bacterium CG08_land_8_20_14_0_20_41_15]
MSPDVYVGTNLEFYSALVYPEYFEGYYGAGNGKPSRFNVASPNHYVAQVAGVAQLARLAETASRGGLERPDVIGEVGK